MKNYQREQHLLEIATRVKVYTILSRISGILPVEASCLSIAFTFWEQDPGNVDKLSALRAILTDIMFKYQAYQTRGRN